MRILGTIAVGVVALLGAPDSHFVASYPDFFGPTSQPPLFVTF